MPELPVVLACQGGSPTSQATGRIAAELARRGIVRLPPGEDDPPPGTPVVVLDGCPSACTARRLTAAGRPLVDAIALSELGVEPGAVEPLDESELCERIAERLRQPAPHPTPPRPERPRHPARPSIRATHSTSDYLLAIDVLAGPVAACGSVLSDAPILAAHVSAALGVSRASAGEMLERLRIAGLVERGPRKELLLTERGRTATDRVVRRHRLLEVFVTELLGRPLVEAYDQARAFDASFDDDSIERLRLALGEPERCPHGWPVEHARARLERESLTSLGSLAAGAGGSVYALWENDPALAQLAKRGVLPGVLVRVVAPLAGGTMLVTIAGDELHLAEDEAAVVLVSGATP